MNDDKDLKPQGEGNGKPIKDLQEKLRQNINWIGIGLLAVVLVILSLFRVDDGGVNLREFPVTWHGWIIWFILSFVPPLIGILILQAFRQEGIRQGHKIPEVKEARDEWLNCVAEDRTRKPMSKEEYYKKSFRKDALTKFTMATVLSVAVASVIISSDFSAFLSLLLQLVMFAGMGAFNLFRSIEFCTDNLILWYKCEVTRIKKEVADEEEQARLEAEEKERLALLEAQKVAEPVEMIDEAVDDETGEITATEPTEDTTEGALQEVIENTTAESAVAENMEVKTNGE